MSRPGDNIQPCPDCRHLVRALQWENRKLKEELQRLKEERNDG